LSYTPSSNCSCSTSAARARFPPCSAASASSYCFP
jgi:hypothetical protein